ncbi:MAG: 3,4-dihydroxy-2-butanone-4-phosphate synthase [Tunicatimonas sp.]
MLDPIPEALSAIQRGEVIIVVDDEQRENEGDFICAAEHTTPEIINFMATQGRGLICAPLTEQRCHELELEMMVGRNTSSHTTPFTVSVDLLGHGCTTGISASDRAKTVQALVNPHTQPEELGRPGHIFPLKAIEGGVLRRSGHTEAAVDFPRLAGLQPAGVLVEIMNEDGTMARLPDLRKVADRFNLKLVSIADLIEYRLTHETLIRRETVLPFATLYGDFTLYAYRQLNTDEVHLALVKGEWQADESVVVRVHAANLLEDVFGAGTDQPSGTPPNSVLQRSLQVLENEARGIVLYMNQNSMGSNLLDRLAQYQRPAKKAVSASSPVMDNRDYGVGAQILRDLGAHKLILLTNHPVKRVGLQGYGLEIVDYRPLDAP